LKVRLHGEMSQYITAMDVDVAARLPDRVAETPKGRFTMPISSPFQIQLSLSLTPLFGLQHHA
jgi:hypothetical protein